MNEMYTEVVMDHYKNPQNFGKIDNCTVSAHDDNPLCGDSIDMDLIIEDGIVRDVKFNGEGCAISVAAASILTEMVKGKKVEEALNFDKNRLVEVFGVGMNPVRVKCALLGYKVFKLCLIKHETEKI